MNKNIPSKKNKNKNNDDIEKQLFQILKKTAKEMKALGLSGEIFVTNSNNPGVKFFEKHIIPKKKKTPDISVSPAELFKKMPFFSCDRRCDECVIGSKCSIYKDLLLLRVGRIMRGDDYKSGEQFFEDIKSSFERAEERVNRYFLKLGVDINGLIAKGDNYREPEQYKLWRKGHELSNQIFSLLNLLFSQEEISEEKMLKNLGEIGWYLNLFETKFYRALLNKDLSKEKKDSFTKKLLEKDANLSAKLAFSSINSVEFSLREINRYFVGYNKWIDSLILRIRSLLEIGEAEFPQLRQEKIIFHGKRENSLKLF